MGDLEISAAKRWLLADTQLGCCGQAHDLLECKGYFSHLLLQCKTIKI